MLKTKRAMTKGLSLFISLLTYNIAFGQFVPLVFNFDTIEPVYVDTALTNNVWQIGKPQKIIFDSAFTASNAILTDTFNTYPQNNISEFIVKTPTYCCNYGGIEMHFSHKYDTDSLLDGGSVYVSLNYGATWYNLQNSPANFPPFNNPFPTIDTIASLNDIGITGKSNGWEHFWYFWNYPQTDTLLVKFKFASDNIQTNKEGWMIDNLWFSYNLGIGISETSESNDYFISPNPFYDQTTLSFPSVSDKTTFTLYNTNGQLVKTIDNITGGQLTIHRDNLATGLYYFMLRTNDSIIATGKLLTE
jgi:hypothetical protein